MRFPRWKSALVALFVTLTLVYTQAFAGPSKSANVPGNLPQAINSGADLELSKKWIEAIGHYEKAIKLFPDNKDLELGLRRSKIQFSIERRYTDNTFHKTLLKMPSAEAQSLFNEVLNQVQHDYVENVTQTSFVAHGTESLYLSLANPRFQQANVPSQYRNRVDKLRDQLNHEFWNKPVASREEAQRIVHRICQLGAEQLGMQPTPIILEYVFGGCNALDDYSSFLTPGRYADLRANIEGQFVGLGVEIKAEAGKGLLLVNVLPDSPAAEGRLLKGEHIVAIDGTDVREMTTDAAAGMLQGLEGTRVAVEVASASDGNSAKTNQRPRRLVLTRRPVVVKSIPVAKIIDSEAGIGYIQMTSFQSSTVEEFDSAIFDLRQQGMRSLVWDLRGNPGGLLKVAVDVLDRLIPDGMLVSTRGRAVSQNESYAATRRRKTNVPLVLLIDSDSASASEIVAGAVKDHRRGTIVGRKTYGKWSVQEIHKLRGNCALKLTTAKFYSPKGNTFGKVGVRPDVEVPEPEKPHGFLRGATEVDVADDADLQKALEVLQKRMASR
jgi:carboxyl-terminal processing protease